VKRGTMLRVCHCRLFVEKKLSEQKWRKQTDLTSGLGDKSVMRSGSTPQTAGKNATIGEYTCAQPYVRSMCINLYSGCVHVYMYICVLPATVEMSGSMSDPQAGNLSNNAERAQSPPSIRVMTFRKSPLQQMQATSLHCHPTRGNNIFS
jgi:hypothetical protein